MDNALVLVCVPACVRSHVVCIPAHFFLLTVSRCRTRTHARTRTPMHTHALALARARALALAIRYIDPVMHRSFQKLVCMTDAGIVSQSRFILASGFQ